MEATLSRITTNPRQCGCGKLKRRSLPMATKATTGAPVPTSARTKQTGTAKRRIRKIFGDIHEVVEMPNLIEVQRESYEQFLRSDRETGYVSGLEKTLRSVFPLRDFECQCRFEILLVQVIGCALEEFQRFFRCEPLRNDPGGHFVK